MQSENHSEIFHHTNNLNLLLEAIEVSNELYKIFLTLHLSTRGDIYRNKVVGLMDVCLQSTIDIEDLHCEVNELLNQLQGQGDAG